MYYANIYNKTMFKIGLRLAFIMLLLSYTIEATCQETYEVVSTSMLNVRSKPTTKSSIIGKLKQKQEVTQLYCLMDLIIVSWPIKKTIMPSLKTLIYPT